MNQKKKKICKINQNEQLYLISNNGFEMHLFVFMYIPLFCVLYKNKQLDVCTTCT